MSMPPYDKNCTPTVRKPHIRKTYGFRGSQKIWVVDGSVSHGTTTKLGAWYMAHDFCRRVNRILAQERKA